MIHYRQEKAFTLLTAEDFKDYASGRRKGLGGFVMRSMMLAASKLYGVGVRYRNRQYDRGAKPSEEVGVPVISIGNLTLGGTGKTPTAAWLARWFRRHDIRVTLISRGYGAEQGELNDEARELDDLLPDVPHLQNPDRVSAAKVAVEELAAQVLLLDDAFQHRRIARSLDIVLLDATEPFGYGYLFPRGMLREPLAGLARADVLALTRADAVSAEERQKIHNQARQYNSQAIWIEMTHRPAHLRNADGETFTLDQLQGKRVAAFCGIGNPAGFRHTISSCGANLVELKPFPDHYIYKAPDIEALADWVAKQRVDFVLCTHKDLVKVGVNQLGETPLAAIVIEAEITVGQAELEEQLNKLVAQVPPDAF